MATNYALPSLGRLEKIELRDVWKRESEDFTPWLAREENLALLGEAIDIDLALEAREKSVGPFRADILCRDTANDTYVLIENQLAGTDHTHLGQLLTYAAGLEAVTIIWIAESFSEEHRAAVDWLNRITGERFNFFGLEIELWRIGDSPPAPKFNIACKPNNWSRSVQQVASGEMTETKQQQFDFWTAFVAYLEKRPAGVSVHKPKPQHWLNHSIGRSGFQLASIASTWNSPGNGYSTPELRVELQINSSSAKDAFGKLEQQRNDIEAKVGTPLTWHNPLDAHMCRIYARTDGDWRDPRQWPALHEWLRQHLERFQRTFGPLVKSL